MSRPSRRLTRKWHPRRHLARTGRKLTAPFARPLRFELLEDRRLLAISWTNRGVPGNDSDGFAGVFGANAEAARNTAQGAIDLWQRVITNLNQSGGVNQLDVSINMAPTGTGFGGSGGPTTLIGNKPRTGAITLNRGDDGNNDGLGDGVNWFLDPTPLDNSEYNNGAIINPFAALPNAGSGIAADFMTLVTVEMAHVLGVANNVAGLAWINNAFVTNTGQADVRDAPGTLWTFDGPTISGLLTSNNGGGGGTDTGLPVHVAFPPNQYFGPTKSYSGVADVGTAGGDAAIRYLPSKLMAHMLRDVYGYTITEPAEFGTFHAMLQADGELRIRGGLPAGLGFPSNDSITVFASGANINVDLDFGNQVAGTGISGNMHSGFLTSQVTSVRIDAGDGDDSIVIGSLQSNIPITVIGGSGSDTLDVGGTSGNDVFTVGFSSLTTAGINITSTSSIDTLILTPGNGTDDVFAPGSLSTVFRIDLPSAASTLNLHTLSQFGAVTINGSAANNTINIAPNGGVNAIQSSVTVNGAAGADTLNLGNGTLASIVAPVTFNGGGGFEDKVVFNDQATTTATIYDVTPSSVFRNLPFAGFSYTDLDRIVINGGSGADSISIANGVFPNVEAHGNNGPDNFTVGGGNLTGIQPQSFDGGDGFDQITFDNRLDSTDRIWDMRNNEIFFGGLIVLSTASFESVGVLGGSGHDEFDFKGVLGQGFNVDGGPNTDTFVLGFQGSVFFSNPVTLQGGAGGDIFTINDAAVSAFTTLSMDGGELFNSMTVNEPFSVGFTIGAGFFTPQGQGTFGFANMNTTIFNGNALNNVYTIYSAGQSVGTVTINGNTGNDSFLLAPQPSGYTFEHLTLDGNQGTDTLTLDASALATDESYTIGSNIIQIARGLGTETITSASMDQITLSAGSGNDSIAVNQYSAGTPVTVNGGFGDDTLNFGGGNLPANITSIAAFTFNGQAGFDRFNLHNTVDFSQWQYIRDTGTIRVDRLGPFFGYTAILNETSIEEMTLNASSGVDTFYVRAIAAGASIILNAGGGLDGLVVADSTQNLQGIQGLIRYNAGAGGGNILVSDNADTTGDTGHLTDTTLGAIPGDNLFGPGGSLEFSDVVNFGDVPGITLNLSSGADTIYAQPLASARVTINAGNPTAAPGDTLNLVLATAQNYVVNGTPANGNVTSSNLMTLSYTGFETGAIADDVAPYIVDTLTDESNGDISLGNLSLREAIERSNFTTAVDTISFSPALSGGTIALMLGALRITGSVTIAGPGAGLLTIDASGNDPTPLAKEGNGSRVFNIDDGTSTLLTVSIAGLTLTGGDVTGFGGGIYSRENLSVSTSTISGNSATTGGGFHSIGGNLTVASSTISGNSATTGGGIYGFSSSWTVTNSTISGNAAKSSGGGILNFYGTVLLAHSTITGNVADSDGNNTGAGGGIAVIDNPYYPSVNVQLNHTIVAGNIRGISTRSDISGLINSARFSFVGDNTGASIVNNGGNVIGTSAAPIDPMLGPLADNGGPTMTHVLLAGSPAIDMGDPSFSPPPDFDQRGNPFTRVYDGVGMDGARIDIGAFELQPILPAFFGDYNQNGVVDAADYTVWRNMLGTSGLTPYSGADGSGDGAIGPEDYGVWKSHFGQTLPGAGSGAAALELVDNSAERVIATQFKSAMLATPTIGVAAAASEPSVRQQPDAATVSSAQRDAALLAWLSIRGSMPRRNDGFDTVGIAADTPGTSSANTTVTDDFDDWEVVLETIARRH